MLPWQKISFKKVFLQPTFGAQTKIEDQIWKYVVKYHGFPLIKWCDTSQSVQQFDGGVEVVGGVVVGGKQFLTVLIYRYFYKGVHI